MLPIRLPQPLKRLLARSRREHVRPSSAGERIKIASQIAGLGTYDTDLTSGRVFVSPELCAIVGVTPEPETTVGRLFEFVHPDDRERVRNLLQKTRAEGRDNTRAELRLVRPDGDVRWVLWNSRTFYEATSTGLIAVRAVGASMDITARKRAEESLRRSEERQWLAIRAANLGTWDWDIPAIRITASERCQQLLRLPVTTPVAPGDFFAAVHPEDRDRLQATIDRVLSRGSDFHEEVRVLCPKGNPCWIAIRGRAGRNEAGNPIRMTGIVADITPQKQAEEALRESEQKLRAFFENAGVGLAQCDAEGRFTDVNLRLCLGLGYSREQLIAKRLYDLVLPEDRPRYWKHFTDLMRQGTNTSGIEIRCIRGDGSIGWLQVTTAVIHNPQGTPISSVKVIEDITQRKLEEESLLQSEKLASVGRMASTMAHEINNPLAAAMNAVYLALADQSLSPESRDVLSVANKELARISQMAQQSLGFYRPLGHPSGTSVNHLLDEVLDLYEVKLDNKSARIIRKYRPIPIVFVVEAEVRQAIANLIANAYDSIPTGGKLILSTSVVPGPHDELEVRISVADNGSGIPKQDLSHVFEAFFTTKKDFGTGLGLWVTNELVKKQHGHIRIRSQVAKGTVASIWLPVDHHENHEGYAA